MIVEKCSIISNIKIAKQTYELVFLLKSEKELKAGQFVNIKLDGFFLRRPISIARILDGNKVAIIYKTVGEGTRKLSELKEDEKIDVIAGLGSFYPLEKRDNLLIIAGGIGVPPMIELASMYRKYNEDIKMDVILGFLDSESIFAVDTFKELGCNVHIATDDGSFGYKGNVIELYEELKEKENLSDFVCACGPLNMLREVEKRFSTGYVSFESRMACGMGVCMACSVKDKEKEGVYHRICKEGAVFPIGRIEY